MKLWPFGKKKSPPELKPKLLGRVVSIRESGVRTRVAVENDEGKVTYHFPVGTIPKLGAKYYG